MLHYISLWLQTIVYNFSSSAYREREYKAMEKFLSQATDRYHLESLEREWDKYHRTIW